MIPIDCKDSMSLYLSDENRSNYRFISWSGDPIKKISLINHLGQDTNRLQKTPCLHLFPLFYSHWKKNRSNYRLLADQVIRSKKIRRLMIIQDMIPIHCKRPHVFISFHCWDIAIAGNRSNYPGDPIKIFFVD